MTKPGPATVTVVIAEKPELAKAIAAALGSGRRGNGFIDCGDHLVTWAFGHMLELKPPEEARWTLASLPLQLAPYALQPITDKRTQLKIIKGLLSRATRVIHAGDPDDEGQLIVDQILDWAQWRGPVRRVLINDNNLAVVKRALASPKDNSKYLGLSYAARYRLIGDWVYGLNLTRAYTLTAQQAGFDQVLSVGRVQTPILGLVVRRDRAHSGHMPQRYQLVKGEFAFGGLSFEALRRHEDGDPVDASGRLNDGAFAQAVAAAAAGKRARIVTITTEDKSEPPPLPFNLLKLQVEASRRWKMRPNKVKDVTQALREVHKLITYNRSDSQYLSDEQHGDAPGVLAAIARTLPSGGVETADADPAIKGRVFDSSKVSAHHAIIPTQAYAKWADLSVDEQRIYDLIARAYILQFLPPRTYRQTRMSIDAGGEIFGVTGSVTLQPGWAAAKWVEAEAPAVADDADDEELSEEALQKDLSHLAAEQAGECRGAWVETKTTKPPPLYTIAALLTDLTRVARYVRDEKLRKVLIERDCNKAGEWGGIGTPATRDTIIASLMQRGYIAEQGKHIVSTQLGQAFYDRLPAQAVYPDMTALWHEQQKTIVANPARFEPLVAALERYVAEETDRARSFTESGPYAPTCPQCEAPLKRAGGSKGVFWRCSTFRWEDKSGCSYTADDLKGKPVTRAKVAVSEAFACSVCGSGLSRRPSKKTNNVHWWGCSSYPNCTQTYRDLNGRPVYGVPEDL